MKSSGFNIEDTHLRDIDRIARLTAMVCIALAWAYLVGEHKDINVKAIRILKHGKRAKSLIKYGLEEIANVLLRPLYKPKFDVFKFFCHVHIFIVYGFKVFLALPTWGMEVSAHSIQHLDVVKPHLRVVNLVTCPACHLDCVPIFVNLFRVVAEVAEQPSLSGFHQSFSLGVGEQLLKHSHGVSAIGIRCVSVALDCVSHLDSGYTHWLAMCQNASLSCLISNGEPKANESM